MSRWFRFYDDVINDPKVLSLPEAMRWSWVAVLCAASKNDGKLPTMDHLGLMLRIPKQRAAAVVAELVSAGLLDKTETGFEPHNWSGRQYKSDVSTERVKRFRNAKRNVSSDVSETPPDTETDTEDRIVDARERDGALTSGSKALADALWKALGIKAPLGVPTELCGTDRRAVIWERAGWTVDLIDAEARRVGPGKPLSYYEKVFATAFAKLQAPLPVVEVRPAETLTVIHGTSQNRSGGSLHAVLDRELAAIEAEERADFALSENPIRRISN